MSQSLVELVETVPTTVIPANAGISPSSVATNPLVELLETSQRGVGAGGGPDSRQPVSVAGSLDGQTHPHAVSNRAGWCAEERGAQLGRGIRLTSSPPPPPPTLLVDAAAIWSLRVGLAVPVIPANAGISAGVSTSSTNGATRPGTGSSEATATTTSRGLEL